MKMEYRNGLLFTSLTLTFRGQSKRIENIVIDTGAAESIISPDVVEDIGIVAELDDSINSFYGVGGSIHNFFSKNVENIKFGNQELNKIKIDFGVIDPKGDINGLLGLDLLMKFGIALNLKELTIIGF